MWRISSLKARLDGRSPGHTWLRHHRGTLDTPTSTSDSLAWCKTKVATIPQAKVLPPRNSTWSILIHPDPSWSILIHPDPLHRDMRNAVTSPCHNHSNLDPDSKPRSVWRRSCSTLSLAHNDLGQVLWWVHGVSMVCPVWELIQHDSCDLDCCIAELSLTKARKGTSKSGWEVKLCLVRILKKKCGKIEWASSCLSSSEFQACICLGSLALNPAYPRLEDVWLFTKLLKDSLWKCSFRLLSEDVWSGANWSSGWSNKVESRRSKANGLMMDVFTPHPHFANAKNNSTPERVPRQIAET